jgi:hypothetical protein
MFASYSPLIETFSLQHPLTYDIDAVVVFICCYFNRAGLGCLAFWLFYHKLVVFLPFTFIMQWICFCKERAPNRAV